MKYKTIKKLGNSEKIFKNSIFLGYASPINSEEEAKTVINSIKSNYNDATHVVYAYLIKSNFAMKYCDDGEPAGSSGKPIINIIERKNLKDIVVVVVRYYGGTKLGYGGLVKAYGDTAKEAIDNGEIIEIFEKEYFEIIISYNLLNTVKKILQNETILNEEYSETVKLTVGIKTEAVEEIKNKLINNTKGNIKIAVKK
ncbi:YigZ family protein [Methanococcus aeolicus]|uniref:Impact N-terminal domain-containing protein n=1 Tax=Methanococcus aeolicus (strain ATCC BAA-1280 / DSM 17508 / OCM 812 / Nankai-3) TaxID=419665 RepID=A6UWS9_META3|nr:YigZ family protein [Methanococcus aeolicus]ABR56951.1 protein of unknown function UPF0029 [Methanococcus aeolicus Nankai-3]UXM84949.1 YigZ family protein [Methanococcus aeolicus]